MHITNFKISVEGGKDHPYIGDAELRHMVFAQLRIVLDDPVEPEQFSCAIEASLNGVIRLIPRLHAPRQLDSATVFTATLSDELDGAIQDLMVAKALLSHLVPQEEVNGTVEDGTKEDAAIDQRS